MRKRARTRAARKAPATGSELVVLVHGMGRTRLSMAPLARRLSASGFEILNWGYASRRATVPDFGAELALAVDDAAKTNRPRRVHFVGHSLGNIVIRWVLANRPPNLPGRVVMLAPPNQGSDLADRWAKWLTWFVKPIGELTTDPASTARSIPTPVRVEIGIIAGGRDHKVRVPRTVLKGQTDHIVVPAGHTFLMLRTDVQALTERFLWTGSFSIVN